MTVRSNPRILIIFNLLGDERLALPGKQVRVAGTATERTTRRRRERERRLFVHDGQDDRMFAQIVGQT
jgi:hypothetical protein